MKEHGWKVFHSVPGQGQHAVTYSPRCQALTLFQTGSVWLSWLCVWIRMSGNCDFMVTSSLGHCFVLLVRERCFTTSVPGRALKRRLKKEWTLAHKTGYTVMWCHMECGWPILLVSACLVCSDPVICDRTEGGTLLWVHAGWEVYMDCNLYMLLLIYYRWWVKVKVISVSSRNI